MALVGAIGLLSSTAAADEPPQSPGDVAVAPAAATAETAPPAATPTPTQAAPRRFGSAGAVVLADVVGIGLTTGGALGAGSPVVGSTGWLRFSDGKSGYDNGQSARSTDLAFAPSFDVFVGSQLSIGGQVSLFRQRLRSGNDVSLVGGGIAPRIGWAFALTGDLTLWMRAYGSASLGHAVVSSGSADGTQFVNRQTTLGWGVGADAMFVAPVTRSVALTFGPMFSYGKIDAIDDTSSSGFTNATSRLVSFGARGGISLVL
ncbi:hypothetical protein BH11MYX4_BH11MYX4_15870 [soil metagenome]